MRRKLSIICILFAMPAAHFATSSVRSDPAIGAEDSKSQTATPAGEVRLQTRVVDTAGKPVLNAAVQVHVLTSREDTHTGLVEFAGSSRVKVDPDGSLLTPALEAGRAYILQVEAPRMVPAMGRWSRPRDTATVRIPDIVLRKLLAVPGTVVGRDGKPIAGATVIQSGDCPDRTDAITDAQGKFTIDGVPEGEAFLFVDAPEYRFTGQKVAAETGPVKFVLERRDDPNPSTIHTIPIRRSKSLPPDLRALALDLIKPRLDEMLAHDPPQWDSDLLRTLPAVESGLVLSNLERLELASPSESDRDSLLCWLADVLAKTDMNAAERLIKKISRPERRLQEYCDILISRLPTSERAERNRLLVEAIEIARKLPEPADRTFWIAGTIAPTLVKYGQTDEARALLAEVHTLADALPRGTDATRSTYGWLARGYASVDSKMAVELLREADPFSSVTVAKVIARRQPDLAERLLSRVDFKAMPGARGLLPEICFRLALVDAHRAERIMWQVLEKIQPPAQGDDDPLDARAAIDQAQLLGLLAEGAVRSDKLKAKQFLEQAMATLLPLSEGHFNARLGWYFAPATVLSTLIPIAEEIDPALAREMFWHSLAMRVGPFKGESAEQQSHDFSLAFLALMLDRYDHGTADVILRPVMERETSRALNGGQIYNWVYVVRARLDPQSTMQFARQLLTAPADFWELPTAATLRQLAAALLTGPRTMAVDEEERTLRELDRRTVRQTLQIYVPLGDE